MGTPAEESCSSKGSVKRCFRVVKECRGEAGPSGLSATIEKDKRHKCSRCDKRFNSPGKLQQHVLMHTGELPWGCGGCSKRFNSKFKLARHRLIHSETRAFGCGSCAKTFHRKDHLRAHQRTHDPVKSVFVCERAACGKRYASPLSYRKHRALHQAMDGDLTCAVCHRAFDDTPGLVHHLKVHQGSRTVKQERDKNFTCPHCARRFFTAKDVRRHLVVHTGRRDFCCPDCPQRFGRKDHLVRHAKKAHPTPDRRPLPTFDQAFPHAKPN